jgi:hypothetical protein
VDLHDGVAVRLAALCLDPGGRLRDYTIWDSGARGALLVDLVLAGRVTQAEDSITVDDVPTGFGPADRLLAAVAVEPERPLDRWLDAGGVGLRDVATATVASGRWTAYRRRFRRRYRDGAAARTARDRALDSRRPDPGWDADTAAVLAIAVACGAVEPPPDPPDDALLALTGPARWMCEAVVEHLVWAHARNRVARLAD